MRAFVGAIVRHSHWVGYTCGGAYLAAGAYTWIWLAPWALDGRGTLLALTAPWLVGGTALCVGARAIGRGHVRRGLAWLTLGAATTAGPSVVWLAWWIAEQSGLAPFGFPGLRATRGGWLLSGLGVLAGLGSAGTWAVALAAGRLACHVLEAEWPRCPRRPRATRSRRALAPAAFGLAVAWGHAWGVFDPALSLLRPSAEGRARFWATRLDAPLTREQAARALLALGEPAVPALVSASTGPSATPGRIGRIAIGVLLALRQDTQWHVVVEFEDTPGGRHRRARRAGAHARRGAPGSRRPGDPDARVDRPVRSGPALASP